MQGCRDGAHFREYGGKGTKGFKYHEKDCYDYLYAFLRKVCRENSVILYLPHESLLNVGQIFYV
jgi:KUP system potassium uptake protein